MSIKAQRPAIYISSPLRPWIDAAKILQQQEGIEPLMWLGSPDDQALRDTFPGIILPDYEQLCEDGWKVLGSKHEFPLHDSVVNDVIPHWDSLISMSERSGWMQLSYQQVRHRLYGMYAYYLYFLKKHKIELVIFAETPHKLASYVLYLVAKSLDIPTPMFVRTCLLGRLFLTDQIGGLPLNFDSVRTNLTPAEAERLIKDDPHVAVQIDSYRTKNAIDNTPPDVLGLVVQEKSGWFNGVTRPKMLSRLPWSKRSYVIARYCFKCLSYPLSEKARTINKLQALYSRLVTPRPKKPFVLVALHRQPERTTNPEGGLFDDQLLMIRLLSSTVPENWTVCVKEHPYQLNHLLYARGYRSDEFYNALAKLPNVQFLPIHSPGAELMLEAEAVATITGTIGFEAAMKGIPVLSFGLPWYAECPGVYAIRTASDLRRSLAKIQTTDLSPKRRDEELNNYLAAILKTSIKAFLHEEDRHFSNVNEEDLALAYSTAFANFLNQREGKQVSYCDGEVEPARVGK